MIPPILLRKGVFELGCKHLRVGQKAMPRCLVGCVCTYVYAFSFGVRLGLLLKHSANAKGRSWLPGLRWSFHGAGSVCLPTLGFSSNFWKACSALPAPSSGCTKLACAIRQGLCRVWSNFLFKGLKIYNGKFKKNVLSLLVLLSGFQRLWERRWCRAQAGCQDGSWTKQEHNNLCVMWAFPGF